MFDKEDYQAPTPAERERLEMLIEEASEVIKCATKILRNGYLNRHPDDGLGETNKKKLGEETLEFFAVAERMMFHGDIFQIDFFNSGKVWKKKLKWTRFQPAFSDPLNRPGDDTE